MLISVVVPIPSLPVWFKPVTLSFDPTIAYDAAAPAFIDDTLDKPRYIGVSWLAVLLPIPS